MVHSEYLEKLFDKAKRKEIIDRLCSKIQESGVIFDTICFQGMSGALIVPTIAEKFDCNFTIVRKNDKSHSSLKVEGWIDGVENYIIIDDLICYGYTCVNIMEKFFSKNSAAKCNGIFLYNQNYAKNKELIHSNLLNYPYVNVYSFKLD